MSTNESNFDNYLTEVEYRSTTFNIGYDLINSTYYSIYPYLGFKGCGINYLYREKIKDETTMNKYLQSNLKYKEITNSRAHLDIGIGISHQWYYLINLRFGYLLPIEKVSWNINNNQTNLTNSPTIQYDFYFILSIGLGGITSYRYNEINTFL